MSHFHSAVSFVSSAAALSLALGCAGAKPAEAPVVEAPPVTTSSTGPASATTAVSPATAAPGAATKRFSEGVAVTVKNPLAIARNSETVALGLPDLLQRLPSLQVAQAAVQDSSGALLLSQLVDSDGNGQPDELVFQVSLAANESKTYLVGQAPRATPKADQYRVYGRFVRERHDDFAWENDRTAHRVYGPELETWAKEPLVSSGVDVWVKRTPRLVINEWYQTDDYHRDNGDGADFYSVGPSRGCGGIGIWDGKQLHVSRNFTRSQVLANGPIRLIFELSYAPWNVAPGVTVTETKRVTVDAGQHFDLFQSSLTFKGKPAGLNVGVGIAKHPGGTFESDKARGSLRAWEPLADDNGHLGCAVLAASGEAFGFTENATEQLLLLPLPSSGPASYLVGTGWDKSGNLADGAAWAAAVNARSEQVRNPLQVAFASSVSAGQSPKREESAAPRP